MTEINQRVTLARRPEGPTTPDCFSLEEGPVAPLELGEIRVAVEWLSIDAFIRTTLRAEGFHRSVPIGGTVGALGAGRVTESTVDTMPVGTAVRGSLGAQTLATMSANAVEPIDESLAPLPAHLGALGLTTGMTAWVGMRRIGMPKPGDTVAISAAAGAVGSIAGQIARFDGARVIGIAGGPTKVAHLVDTLGFDAAIDYKNEDVNDRLSELAPDGVDVFFDNVGGDILDAALDNLAMQARVIICGAISQYDNMENVTGPSLYLRLAERQSRMEGFAVYHFRDSYEQATSELAAWLADGSLVMPEHIVHGLDHFADALQVMFTGANLGKTLVRVE